ncbi:hypothetical protein BJQ94_08590 [Cryobacterium sp. SO2]|uniref:hypothetical protein n=1 Tax=Cryobacterium sp. SO2 TaxID=1897060 RepID=UPI0023DB5FA0|nr:hypothetical protein [Cryobacterium sp. SO2]WEO79074.1 hypothetical protein BJQ94_08590 [Cryobacterium sp. SO2]
MTSENNEQGTPSGPVPPQPERSPWRRQAGFLGAAFAVAAAVIAAGLRFAPQASAYSGLSPWVFSGLLGFVLVLGGACVLFAASFPAAPPRPARPVQQPSAPYPGPEQPPPAPGAFPDGSFPDGSFPDGSYPDGTSPAGTAPTAPSSPPYSPIPGIAPANEASAAQAQAAAGPGDSPTAGRSLTILGALLAAAGLALATLAVAIAVLLPTPTESIMVQFTDLYGRVQLEYCPTLPGSFAATASHDDLVASSTILPVKVSAETCGNPDYTDGVWLYLNRASITVSDRP